MSKLSVRVMTNDDYDAVLAIWQVSEGIALTRSDSREGVERFLARNPGLSYVAALNGRIVGGVLCGHDGRRGLIHHLAVHPQARRQGVGRVLIDRCLEGLRRERIEKCHLFIHHENIGGQLFWRQTGWIERDELVMMTMLLDPADDQGDRRGLAGDSSVT